MAESLSIRKKVLLSTGALSIAVMTILVISFYAMTYRNIKSFEIENAGMNIKRVIHEISTIKKGLYTLCTDWASWDETYFFVNNKDKDYIEANLNEKTLINMNANILIFINKNGEVVHSNFLTPISHSVEPFPDDLLKRIMGETRLTRHESINSKTDLTFLYSEMPVMLVSKPIIRNDYTGPINGTLILGRIFPNEEIEAIGRNLQLGISILPGKYIGSKRDHYSEYKISGTDVTSTISTTNLNQLVAYISDKNPPGSDSFTVLITMPRDFANMVLKESLVYFATLAASIFAVLVLFIFFTDSYVLSPLFKLSKSAKKIASEADFSARLEKAKGKEFGLLSESLNDMLDSLEKYHLDHMKDRDALIQSEAYLSKLLDSIDCGIISADRENNSIININQAGMEMIGLEKEYLIGKPYTDFIKDSSDSNEISSYECSSLSSCEGTIYVNDTKKIPILRSVAPIKRKDQHVIILTFVDISVLKATEEQIRKNEARYREFFEQDLTGDFLSDVNGKILDCNIAFARIFGYDSVEEIKNIDSTDLYVVSESRNQLLDIIRRERFLTGIKWTMKKRNGDPIYLIGNVIGVFNDNDELCQIRGYLFDDTERLLLEKALRQAYKMEAIGTLAGGIAHDFNNILSAIMGHAELCHFTTGDHPDLKERLEKIIDSTKRAKNLVKQILTFSTRKDADGHTIEIGPTITEAINIVKSTIPARIDIRTDIMSDALVKADPNHIHQIMINICTNAIEAMADADKGMIEIAVDDAYLDSDNDMMAKYGDYIRISVADTGHGMTPEVIDRIFDPFFTTRQKFGKTGMGLSVVHGIIKNLDGAIRVESEPDEGAVFEIFLPKQSESQQSLDNESNANIISLFSPDGDSIISGLKPGIIKTEERLEPNNVKTDKSNQVAHKLYNVLVVEDEAIILEMLVEMIKNMGFHPIGFKSPIKALERFRSAPEDIAIVMTDLSMPDMGGDKLSEEIFNISPDTPVIISSGFSGKKYAEESKLKGPRFFLKKPIVSGVLSNTLKEIVEHIEGRNKKPQG